MQFEIPVTENRYWLTQGAVYLMLEEHGVPPPPTTKFATCPIWMQATGY
jgi:hypothetical protein